MGASASTKRYTSEFNKSWQEVKTLVADDLRSLGLFNLLRMCKPIIYETFSRQPLTAAAPVTLVICILLLIFCPFVVTTLLPMGMPAAALNSAANIFLGACIVLALRAYYNGVVIDPGHIPDTSEWAQAPRRRLLERKHTTGAPRFCEKESKYKPDRAHFCSQVNRNVLRMDHYCPWLANCVGFYNHKFFLLFLLYATIAINMMTLNAYVLPAAAMSQPLAATLVTQLKIIGSVLGGTLTPFTTFHFWLMTRNLTTLDFCEKRRRAATFTSMWDMGRLANIQQVLGTNPWLWLLPVYTPVGDGLSFPVNPNHPGVAEAMAGQSDDDENAHLLRGPESQSCPLACVHGTKEVLNSFATSMAFLFGAASPAANRRQLSPR